MVYRRAEKGQWPVYPRAMPSYLAGGREKGEGMRGKDSRRLAIAAVMLLSILLAAAFPGCGSDDKPAVQDARTDDGFDPGDGGEDRGDDGEGNGGHGADVVYMCGRSVLDGWFEHWGWDGDPGKAVSFGSFSLVYREMECPPDIVDGAIGVARESAGKGNGTLFFKLCFEDFEGGDENAARDNLEANEGMIGDVVRAVVEEEGLVLILGNALPMVNEYTDEWLIWNHREYNSFLAGLAAEYGGRVFVLDLYGVLAAPGGWLRPEYAAEEYDSHLNEAAYDALDDILMEMLGG
jgi:hypothetical protein